MKKKKKYATGTGVNNYIANPYEVLQEDRINKAQAIYEGETNPLVNVLKLAGNLTMNYAAGRAAKTETKKDDDIPQGLNILDDLLSMAYGGKVPQREVELEGGEVVENVDGTVQDVTGPSHENGGVDALLTPGSEVFSKRVKFQGDTMADRKKNRARKEKRTSKALNNNPDKITKNTSARTKTNNEKEEMTDLSIQDFVKQLLSIPSQSGKEKMALGSGPGLEEFMINAAEYLKSPDFNPNAGEEESNPFKLSDIFGDTPTGGDILGLTGNLISTFTPYFTTLKNRAGDTPNINAFKDFGKDALDTIDQSKQYATTIKDEALGDINLSKASNIKRLRSSARGVNQMRALDLAASKQADEATGDVYSNFSQQMMNILGQEAQLENVQDRFVMQGEQQRDLADRLDRDNFYTQLAKSKTNIGKGLQQTGKDLNAIKQREIVRNLINELSKYGIEIDDDGNLTYNEEE